MNPAQVGPLDVPTGFAVVMTAVTALYVPYLIRKWRVIWRGSSPVFEEPFPWWVWGEALWRAYVRVLPLGATVLAILLVCVVALIYGPGGDAGVVVAVGIAVLTLALWVMFMVSIALFNRPHSLVPPPRRGEAGAVTEWRNQWRRRNADPAGS